MIAARLAAAREATLAFVGSLDDADLSARPHDGFSPIGWHLGHVAFTEAQWIVERCGGDPSLSSPFARAFAQDGRPKHERVDLPPRAELLAYLEAVRERTLAILPAIDPASRDPLHADGFVAWLIESHEHQHRETMAIVRQCELERRHARVPPPPPSLDASSPAILRVPGGECTIGTDERLAYDNERPRHAVAIDDFAIDALPVTVGAWERFRAEGGYERASLWTEEGWAWRAEADVRWPLGWTRDGEGRLARVRLDGVIAPLAADDAVTGVSFYEASAFARFSGARLPTEAEWERAATLIATNDPCLALAERGPRRAREPDLIGNVWEWTASPFAPYPGFAPFPYRGYSDPYFDGAHFVLRGGSFATHPRIARATFRTWYQPWIRETFTGLRLARPA